MPGDGCQRRIPMGGGSSPPCPPLRARKRGGAADGANGPTGDAGPRPCPLPLERRNPGKVARLVGGRWGVRTPPYSTGFTSSGLTPETKMSSLMNCIRGPEGELGFTSTVGMRFIG